MDNKSNSMIPQTIPYSTEAIHKQKTIVLSFEKIKIKFHLSVSSQKLNYLLYIKDFNIFNVIMIMSLFYC